VILNCNFEELRALSSGADLARQSSVATSDAPVVAPSEALPHIDRLQPRLDGSLSINTLAEQQSVRLAVAAICENLHDRLEAKVLEFHPAHEEAVNLYFDYAHAFAVLSRLDEMGAEMRAMIEVMTGTPASSVAASSITFPD
jgi:hypothetical protein